MKNLGCLMWFSPKIKGIPNLTKFKSNPEKKSYLTILYLNVTNIIIEYCQIFRRYILFKGY